MFGKRNRTSSLDIEHALYLYFLGLSTRRLSKAIFCLRNVKRIHIRAWKWIQKYHPKKVFSSKGKISEFIVDKTLLKIGSEYVWLWVAIKPENRQILTVTVPRERNMLIAERFISRIVKIHGKHPLTTNGGT